MSLIGAIRWAALKAIHPNNRLVVLRQSPQLPTNGSIRCLSNMFGKISKELENIVPEKPKRPLNGYLIFFKDFSAQLRAQNPTFKVKDLAKAVGDKWQQLDPIVKQELTDRAEKDKEEYKQLITKWKNSLNDKQKENYLIGIKSRKRVLAKRRLKVELKRLEYPIRSKSAFNLYIKDAINRSVRTDEPFVEVFKRIVAKWRTLSPEERAPFVETAKNDKLRYLEELEEWKSNIAKQQNKEVLANLMKLKTQSSKASLTTGLNSEKKTKKVVKKKIKAKKPKSMTIKANAKSKTSAKLKSKNSRKQTKSKLESMSKSKSKESKSNKSKKLSKQESDSSDSEK